VVKLKTPASEAGNQIQAIRPSLSIASADLIEVRGKETDDRWFDSNRPRQPFMGP
jgi:hypothetical protein